MKNLFRSVITAVIFTTIILPLMAPGCGGEREINVGYFRVDIPHFNEADYLPMLNNKDEEIQYNSICYFIDNNDYDQYLTVDSLKATSKHDTALMIYRKIYSLMDAKNTWVSSAAILFLSDFEYNRKSYLQNLLKNNIPSLNIQLQIIMILSDDSSAMHDPLLSKKINFLQQQPSWLLQNGAYLLLKEKDSIDADLLMNNYTNAAMYQKLFILDILTNHITDTVFSFLTREWANNKDSRIKEIILAALPKAKNPERVLDWYNEHGKLLEENIKGFIDRFGQRDSNEIFSKLIVLAIRKGWNPSSLKIKSTDSSSIPEPTLFYYLFEDKYDPSISDGSKVRQTAKGKRIEETFLQYPSFKKEWQDFERRKFRYPLPEQLIMEHQRLTETYLQNTRLLLERYTADTTLYNNFKHQIDYWTADMQKTKVKTNQ